MAVLPSIFLGEREFSLPVILNPLSSYRYKVAPYLFFIWRSFWFEVLEARFRYFFVLLLSLWCLSKLLNIMWFSGAEHLISIPRIRILWICALYNSPGEGLFTFYWVRWGSQHIQLVKPWLLVSRRRHCTLHLRGRPISFQIFRQLYVPVSVLHRSFDHHWSLLIQTIKNTPLPPLGHTLVSLAKSGVKWLARGRWVGWIEI